MTDSILLYYNKMSIIQLARNPIFHAQTKHIEVHYHVIRDSVLVGDVDLQHINTHLKKTDILTKTLGVDKLWQFTMNLGLSIADHPSLRGSKEGLVTHKHLLILIVNVGSFLFLLLVNTVLLFSIYFVISLSPSHTKTHTYLFRHIESLPILYNIQ